MDARRLPTRVIGTLILFLPVLFLFSHQSFLQPRGGRITGSYERSPPINPKSAHLPTIETSPQSIVHPFDQQEYILNLTTPPSLSLLEQSHLFPRDGLNYGVAICNGNRNWKMITDAFAGGRDPGRDFTFDDFDNGWDSDEHTQLLDDRWQAPLRYISNQLDDVADNTAPDPEDVHFVELRQDKQFVNDEGRET
ncbi:MAG: hypothetical protein LQ346_008290, partial [Caloplaca aetnensis]